MFVNLTGRCLQNFQVYLNIKVEVSQLWMSHALSHVNASGNTHDEIRPVTVFICPYQAAVLAG